MIRGPITVNDELEYSKSALQCFQEILDNRETARGTNKDDDEKRRDLRRGKSVTCQARDPQWLGLRHRGARIHELLFQCTGYKNCRWDIFKFVREDCCNREDSMVFLTL